MRLAAVDIGTNTALLLIADVEDGRLKVLHDEERFVRLGAGVDASGRVNEAAQGRLADALRAYRETVDRFGVDRVTVGATSASRDAANQDELVALAKREADFPYGILSGEDEAALTFQGAASGLPAGTGTIVVTDLGGGSMEVVVGDASTGEIAWRTSLQVGAVRVTERFFSSIPPLPDEIDAAEAYLAEQFDTLPFPVAGAVPFPLIGTTGSTTGRLASLQGETNDAGLYTISAEDVLGWRNRLSDLTEPEILALDSGALEGRSDVFTAGVLILEQFATRFGFSRYTVSSGGLRHGLALRAASRGA
ncbi:MAG: hypothetical protein AAF752_01195 [Bacteroidota bacterium]